ncbi:MAG: Rieske 2Fe-2S domain-containing protein [Chloroflexota bacterium]
MLSQEENELLCRVGPDAPMGQMLRRYWIPACLSRELPEADGTPIRVRLLGENLVAFRDSDGRVGFMDELCPHRGASLVLARNERSALQCLYHGWRIALDGTILETPCEPEESDFKDRIRHIAYPTREQGGMLWVYLGPPGTEPDFPEFGWTVVPEEQRVLVKMVGDCNWAQSLEGVIDSSHSSFLHSSEIVGAAAQSRPDGTSAYQATDAGLIVKRPTNDRAPRLEPQDTDYGFRYAAIRKPIQEPDKYQYIRVTLFVAPFYGFIAPPAGWGLVEFFVPIDDEHTAMYHVEWREDAPVDHDRQYDRSGAVVGRDIDVHFRKFANQANNWLQDRAAMKAGSFSGIRGVQVQDQAVLESMGAVYDRTREHLGTSDVAIIRWRRLMLDSVRRFQEGGVPVGLERTVPFTKLKGEERIIPLETPWQVVGAFAGEASK